MPVGNQSIVRSSAVLEPTWEIESAGSSSLEQSPVRTLDGASSSRAIAPQASPVHAETGVEAEPIQAPQAVQHALRGNFAGRHPKAAMALAGVAATVACFASAVVLAPAFLVAAPARLFLTAVGIISPKLALDLLKNQPLKLAVGAVADIISRIAIQGATTNRQRGTSALLLGADVASVGISISVVSAMEAASTIRKTTQKSLAMALGFSETAFNAHTGRNRLLGAEARIRREVVDAPDVMAPIETFFKRVGSEARLVRSGITASMWKKYDRKFVRESRGAATSKAFSALLKKNLAGFDLHSRYGAVPTIDFKNFVNNRLHPVLCAMKNNENVAKNVFALAEQGLGACSDRAVSVWQTVELSALSLQQAALVLESLKKSNNQVTPDVETHIKKFVEIERQRFRLNEVKSYTDYFIQDAQRNPSQGGWQERQSGALYKPYADRNFDHVEVILGVCDIIQKVDKPRWYPSFPYKNHGSGFDGHDMAILKNKVIAEVSKIESDTTHAKFIGHLKETDAWQQIVSTVNPEVSFKNDEAVHVCEEGVEALGELDQVFSEADKYTEYANAMEGLGALRCKFNGEKVSAQDAALTLPEFLDQKLALCAPAEIRLESLMIGTVRPELLKAHSTWNDIIGQSNPITTQLTAMAELDEDEEPDMKLLAGAVEHLNAVLGQVKALTATLPQLSNTVIDSMKSDIQKEFDTRRTVVDSVQGDNVSNTYTLSNTLKAVLTLFSSAKRFVGTVGQIKTSPFEVSGQQVGNQFAQKYINMSSKPLSPQVFRRGGVHRR